MKEDPKFRESIKWAVGILEDKNMLKLDHRSLGPIMKPEHLCQLYWTMLCTATYWGEYLRTCHETKESRAFLIYLDMDIARKLEACVARMMREMIAGTPYRVACDSQQNEELVDVFRKRAFWFNQVETDQQGEKSRFRNLPWPADLVALFDKTAADYDICYVDRPLTVVAASPHGEPAKKRQRKKAATTTAKPRAPPKMQPGTRSAAMASEPAAAANGAGPVRFTPASIMPALQMQQQQTVTALLRDLCTTHEVLLECMQNGHYGEALDSQVFHVQICRLLELHGICKTVETLKRHRYEEAQERDE